MSTAINSDIKDLLSGCRNSTKLMAKVLFPERFFRKFCSLHDEIFALLDDESKKRVVIAAPRGFGKTSIVALPFIARRILFDMARYVIYISLSATSATEQTENLKYEMMYNDLVKKIFNPQKSENTWSKDEWDISLPGAKWPTRIRPRGGNQQIRGRLYLNFRPDLIVVDDIEDKELVRNEDRREELKRWFNADVCNSVDRGTDDWRIVVIGTILHEDGLLANLIEDPSWHSIVLQLCDDDFNTNWEDFMSTEQVKDLVEQHRDKGLLDEFYMEYMNTPIATENAPFSQAIFKYYEEEDLRKDPAAIENVILVDPAKCKRRRSNETAIVGVGADFANWKIYIRDIVHGHMHPNEMYTAIIDMADRLKARVVGVEVTSLEEFIVYPLKNELSKQNKFLNVVELKARGSKEDRVRALSGLYRQGYVYHNKATCGVLERQLLSYPKSKHWDVMDATAYLVELLEIGERFFESPGSIKDRTEVEEAKIELMNEEDREIMPRLRGYGLA